MKLALDLHSHSGYAGGVGDIPLASVAETMKKKGIDVFGTGDSLLPQRVSELKAQLKDINTGLFLFNNETHFLLQTEIILSTKLPNKKNKTIAHHIILFPDFGAIERFQYLFIKHKQKNTIGRPFFVTQEQAQLEDLLFEMKDVDPLIEIIPAHVMTPDGIMGSKNQLSSIREFYGQFTPNIRIIETGLSADPSMLNQIADFHSLTMISNSDCHSAALNRIGREFSVVDSESLTYKDIIMALRANQVDYTAEFNPGEGRYFLTGHRKDRPGHTCEVVFTDDEPLALICPVCQKPMLQGVKNRCAELQDNNLVPLQRKFHALIPLIEAIALALKTNLNNKKVIETYNTCLLAFGTEIQLWQSKDDLIIKQLSSLTNDAILKHILSIKKGLFSFSPPGYDGVYGNLVLSNK